MCHALAMRPLLFTRFAPFQHAWPRHFVKGVGGAERCLLDRMLAYI